MSFFLVIIKWNLNYLSQLVFLLLLKLYTGKLSITILLLVYDDFII